LKLPIDSLPVGVDEDDGLLLGPHRNDLRVDIGDLALPQDASSVHPTGD
jgi:hypothetical protein